MTNISKSLIDKIDLYEMANVSPKDTGLSVYVYVSPNNSNHGPRIKVSNIKNKSWSDDNFSLSICDKPELMNGVCKLDSNELDDTKNWIILNKNILLDYWNNKIQSTKEFLLLIKSI